MLGAIAFALSSLVFGAASASASAAAQPKSAPARVEAPRGNLTAVSCPSTAFCAVTDNVGNLVTGDGQHWSAPVTTASVAYLTSVSCATAG